MPTWATANDVIDSWIGTDAPSNTVLVETWIGKAEREIRVRIPDIQSRLDAEAELDPPSTDLLEAVVDVVVAMVTRVFRNPTGVRTRNETTGPFTGSITYGGDTPGVLGLTDDELAKLSGLSGSRSAFTIDLIPSSSPFSPSYSASFPFWPEP